MIDKDEKGDTKFGTGVYDRTEVYIIWARDETHSALNPSSSSLLAISPQGV